LSQYGSSHHRWLGDASEDYSDTKNSNTDNGDCSNVADTSAAAAASVNDCLEVNQTTQRDARIVLVACGLRSLL